MGENIFSCTEGSKKGFSLEEIKGFSEGKKKEDYELIMKFYFELLLLSEVIDNTYEDTTIRRKMGFYLDNQEEIPFDKITFLNFENNGIKYITGSKNFFYKQSDVANSLYYSVQYNKWYVHIEENLLISHHIDELYFHGVRKKAKNIQVCTNKPFSEKSSLKVFDNFKKNKSCNDVKKDFENYSRPIGVKYIFSQLNEKDIVFFVDSKEIIRNPNC